MRRTRSPALRSEKTGLDPSAIAFPASPRKSEAEVAPAAVTDASRSNSRLKLMQAAEKLVAERGIKAVSIRDIAADAGVNSALIAYYFGSKEELIIAVYRAIAEPINAERHRRLDVLDRSPCPPTIEELLEAWIDPVFVDYLETENTNFVQLAMAIALYDPTASGRLAAETFREINERFIGMLQRHLPGIPRKTLVWRLYFLIGTLITATHQRTRGMRALSQGHCNPNDLEEWRRELINFAAAGFRSGFARPAGPIAAH